MKATDLEMVVPPETATFPEGVGVVLMIYVIAYIALTFATPMDDDYEDED